MFFTLLWKHLSNTLSKTDQIQNFRSIFIFVAHFHFEHNIKENTYQRTMCFYWGNWLLIEVEFFQRIGQWLNLSSIFSKCNNRSWVGARLISKTSNETKRKQNLYHLISHHCRAENWHLKKWAYTLNTSCSKFVFFLCVKIDEFQWENKCSKPICVTTLEKKEGTINLQHARYIKTFQ